MRRRAEFKIPLGLFFATIFLVVGATISVTVMFDLARFNKKLRDSSWYDQVSLKLYELDKIVKNQFDGVIDEERLVDEVMKGYLSGIGDKDSKYFSPEEYKLKKKEMRNQNILWGVRFAEDGGYLRIDEIYENYLALDVDLQLEDLIIKVEDVNVTHENIEECVKMLNANEGTKIRVSFRRGLKEFEKELVVRYAKVSAVQSDSFGDVAYIRILSFNEPAVKFFSRQVSELLSKKRAVIIDLRDTGAGSLDCAAKILKMILPQGLIVSSIREGGEVDNLFYSDGRHEVKKPMIVLANEKTMGVAELFIHVLKCYEKVQVVGERTAGKGKMQTFFELQDGAAIELTVAKFGLPDGNTFDGTGIMPDFRVQPITPLTTEKKQEVKMIDKSKDLQLAKALEVLEFEDN
ncbi:MAG: hypothetical protein LBJ83_03440 [Oscillospiraceae bacterium]|jgi:carboxyl-terminal processing protease|nr:hypothetical protein [Oscillospiraceae bacterium]